MTAEVDKNGKEGIAMTPEAIKKLAKALAVVTVTIGGIGSIACVPFAFTTDLRLIAAAGVYFIAGAVMIIGGQVAYALLLKAE
jgi:hypothetical protein